MRWGSRARPWSALIGALVILSGCAAGSPAIIAPDEPAPIVAEAPEVEIPAPAPETETETEMGAAIGSPAAETAPALATIDEPPDVETAEVAASVSVVEEPAPADIATVSFAQDVPLASEPVVAPDEGAAPPPAAEPVVQAVPETAPAVAEPVTGSAAAPPAQTSRPAPPPDPGTGMSEMISGGSNGRLEVALTFDAGADRGFGVEILDLLRDEGIKATFGMTGVYAESNPDVVQRMVAEGHQLINHTWDHPSLTGANTGMPPLTAEQVAAQLWETENIVSEVTGGYQMLPYFRPPYGDYDANSLGYLYNNGYYLSIWWTCDSHGWAEWSGQEIIDYCTTNLVEDEILLLHVGAAAAGDYEALPGLIQSFRDLGYAFVTVEEMLQP